MDRTTLHCWALSVGRSIGEVSRPHVTRGPTSSGRLLRGFQLWLHPTRSIGMFGCVMCDVQLGFNREVSVSHG